MSQNDFSYSREQRTGENVARFLADCANGWNHQDEREFSDALSQQHRTLQQAVGRIFQTWIFDLAKRYRENPSVWFDGRNEALGRMAVELQETIERLNLFLPLI